MAVPLDVVTDDRDALHQRLRDAFPEAAERDDRLAPDRGGRSHGLRRLDQIEPGQYTKTRNMIDGAVTRLSPYLRHRCITTAEARRKAEERGNSGKLVQELAWHDYFQRVYAAVGEEGVWESLEPWKTGYGPSDYAVDLPPEIEAGETGVDWIDHFANQLSEGGWLHNHARMWLACYVVHARRVSWQAGASWFLRHLVDGDPASNNLSWQWVASTFSAKPYFMNRGNVVKFSNGRFPPHAKNDPLDAPYDVLANQLFAQGPDATQDAGDGLDIDLRKQPPGESGDAKLPGDAVAFVHRDMLSPEHPALVDNRRGVYVFDRQAASQVTLKPLGFIAECLAELPNVTVLVADDVEAAVRDFADGHPIVTGGSPSKDLRKIGRSLDATVVDTEPFVHPEGQVDLKRFSRYWKKAQKALSPRRDVAQ
jgi:deoxyribodipyrimidine photo-lyase